MLLRSLASGSLAPQQLPLISENCTVNGKTNSFVKELLTSMCVSNSMGSVYNYKSELNLCTLNKSNSVFRFGIVGVCCGVFRCH